jgi:DNA-binding response OmpR family regulator
VENASLTRDVLVSGELEVRTENGLVLAAGRAVPLSVREFELLVALMRRAGEIIGRTDLYTTVWGGEMRGGDRSIDVYIHKLRSKLEAALPEMRFIHTHVGFGYRFAPGRRPMVTDLNGSEPLAVRLD